MLYIHASPFGERSHNCLQIRSAVSMTHLDQPYYVDPVICPIKIKISLGALDKVKIMKTEVVPYFN